MNRIPDVAAGKRAAAGRSLRTMAHEYGVDLLRGGAANEVSKLRELGRLSDADQMALQHAAEAVEKAEAWAAALRVASARILEGSNGLRSE